MWGTLYDGFFSVDFAWGLYVVGTLLWRLYIWNSYITNYMIIENEVKFILVDDNLILIIFTTPSLQPQFTFDV